MAAKYQTLSASWERRIEHHENGIPERLRSLNGSSDAGPAPAGKGTCHANGIDLDRWCFGRNRGRLYLCPDSTVETNGTTSLTVIYRCCA